MRSMNLSGHLLLATLLLSLAIPQTSAAQDEPQDEALPADGAGGAVWVEEDQAGGDAAAPEEEVDVNYFFDKLAPYGEWLWTPEYGWVWKPSNMAPEWRPFTYGRWVYTEYGWTWVSSHRWGWAPFHYGSWTMLEHVGWVWIPGSTWSPAQVIWRYSDGYVGWAPMLAGYGYWYGWGYYPVYYDHWTFIDWGHFCDNNPHHHYAHHNRARDMFRHSYYPRRCRDQASSACRRGPARDRVAELSRKEVPVRKVNNLATRQPTLRPSGKELGVRGEEVRVFRPQAKPRPRPAIEQRGGVAAPALRRPGVRRTIDLGEMPDNQAPRPAAAPAAAPASHPGAYEPETAAPPFGQPRPGATIHPERPSKSAYPGSDQIHTPPRPTRPDRLQPRPAPATRPDPRPRVQPPQQARPQVHNPRPAAPRVQNPRPAAPKVRAPSRPATPSRSNARPAPKASSRSSSDSSGSKSGKRR